MVKPMNSAALVYVVLFLYPLIALLVPEPNRFLWWWRTGGGVSEPADVTQRARRNEGNLFIVKFALLDIACFFLARDAFISFASLGFRPEQPKGTLFIGAAAGILLIGWTFAMRSAGRKIEGYGVHSQDFVSRESTLRIFLILVLGGLAEEFWRALALTTLDKQGISVGHAIFFTSVFFGIGHVSSYRSLGYVLGRMLGPAIVGVALAILFLWSRTLFTPFVIHVLLNSVSALMGRRRVITTMSDAG